MDITLVRHGQSEHNAGLTDFLDSGLTALGREQAQKTASELSDQAIDLGFVSPLRRTLETMEPIAAAGKYLVHIEPKACEYFSTHLYRKFPGMTVPTIRQEFPYVGIPPTLWDCETWWMEELEGPMEIYARCVEFREHLKTLPASTRHVLIVTHAEPLGRFIEAAQHIPPNLEGPPWSDNCGISRLSFENGLDEPATVRFINHTYHLK